MDQRKACGIKNALLEIDAYMYYFGFGRKKIWKLFLQYWKAGPAEGYFFLEKLGFPLSLTSRGKSPILISYGGSNRLLEEQTFIFLWWQTTEAQNDLRGLVPGCQQGWLTSGGSREESGPGLFQLLVAASLP